MQSLICRKNLGISDMLKTVYTPETLFAGGINMIDYVQQWFAQIVCSQSTNILDYVQQLFAQMFLNVLCACLWLLDIRLEILSYVMRKPVCRVE